MSAARWYRTPVEFRWPPRPVFSFYNGRGMLLFKVSDANLDLSDTLMLHWNRPTRLIYMGIRSRGGSWQSWTEARLRHVETLITYDLSFDGDNVSIKRAPPRRGGLCTSEFRWRLKIRAM